MVSQARVSQDEFRAIGTAGILTVQLAIARRADKLVAGRLGGEKISDIETWLAAEVDVLSDPEWSYWRLLSLGPRSEAMPHSSGGSAGTPLPADAKGLAG